MREPLDFINEENEMDYQDNESIGDENEAMFDNDTPNKRPL